jgi:hypothetical protein
VTYKIARDGQEFGPYSLADVQRYVGTGNILLNDLALAEGATDWIPVAQVVGTIAVQPAVPAGYAAVAMPDFPDPPDLHWALVLLFGMITCGIFQMVWELVQTMWMKKVQPDTKVLLYNLIFLALWVLNFVFAFGRGLLVGLHRTDTSMVVMLGGVSSFISIGMLVMMIVYRFVMRSSLLRHFNEADPIGLSLSGVMTFFFGEIYFQYHFNRINAIKRAYRLGNPS